MVMPQGERFEGLHRVARMAGAPASAVVLALPLSGAGALAAIGWLDVDAALGSKSVHVWIGALVVLLVVGGVTAALERRWVPMLARASALALVLQGIAWSAFRFDATFDVGEGERGVPPRIAVRGKLARIPTVMAIALPSRVDGTAELQVGGLPVLAPVSQETRAPGGLAVEVLGVFAAPSFRLTRPGGAIEGEGTVKFVPGERDYFQVALLPHRFYLTLPRLEGMEVALAPRLSLEIYRGKIRVGADAALPVGTPLVVEGLSVQFADGARWARVRVRATPGRAPLWLSGGLALAAFAVALRRRQARKR